MRLELTRRGAYAVRAAIALARSDEGVLPARRIAAEMRIPERFLPQVMGDLVRAGMVEARLGRRGGYRLCRPASAVSLRAVIEAVEPDARRRTCVLRGGACGADAPCDLHAVFESAQAALLGHLEAMSVADAAGTA